MMAAVRTQLIDDPRFLGGVFQSLENAYNSADYAEALQTLVVDIIGDHAGYFTNRTDPSGKPWQPLSPVTVARKGHDQPLVLTNEMRSSLLIEGHVNHVGGTANRGLVFGTSDEKASIHQHGGGRIPARPFVGLTEQRTDAIANAVADSLVEMLKG